MKGVILQALRERIQLYVKVAIYALFFLIGVPLPFTLLFLIHAIGLVFLSLLLVFITLFSVFLPLQL